MTVEERCKNGYSLNRRQLFRWMYSHGYSKAKMAHSLKITKKEFIWRLDFWEPFEKWQIKRLVRIMKAKAAFFAIYFHSRQERKDVYFKVFGCELKCGGKKTWQKLKERQTEIARYKR